LIFRLGLSTGKDAVHFSRQLLQTVEAVGAGLLGNAPAIIADLRRAISSRRPVIVTLQKLDVEAFPQTLVVRLSAEFLMCNFWMRLPRMRIHCSGQP